jgi:hypothetical protein
MSRATMPRPARDIERSQRCDRDFEEEITVVATLRSTGPARTWLVPGQILRSSDPAWMGDFTVSRIVRDTLGFCHAVLHDESGREISTFVDQIHYSIAEGMLTPLNHEASRITFN